MKGQLLDGRYRVVEVLGTGAFGQTYVAEDTRRPGNPKCVLKHLKPARTDPEFLPTARRLFNSEAETLEQLGNHDQIPRLLAYFEENQEFYLVQEFIEGNSLSAELPPGLQWAEEQVTQLLKEVLSILEFVHSQGVIHRDIKPDNLIRRHSDNKLVLIDFGAVKQIGLLSANSQELPNPTIAIGTSGYLPTEQSKGKPRFNSDIYALGIIGLQASTGLSASDLEEDTNTGEIVWEHLVSVSPGLAKILTQMVRYHFRDRYQNAAEALQALQALSLVRKPEPARNWKLLAGLGMGVIAIAFVMVFINKSENKSDPPKPTISSVSGTTQPTSLPKPAIDYSRLQAFLQEKPPNWEAADQETYELMLKIAGHKSVQKGLFEESEWKSFPCDALKRIDTLWSEASDGNLGFSAQKKIFNDAGKQSSAYFEKIGWKTPEGEFKVDWKRQNLNTQRFEYFNNDGKATKPEFKNPPAGHLPAKLQWWDNKGHRFDEDKTTCLR